MRIHWGFKEEILKTLANAAKTTDQSTEQILLLNEASVLLWRFDSEVLPRSAEALRTLLELDIEDWLPKTVHQMYKGPLMSMGKPTFLCDIILIDLSEDALSRRDSLITTAINDGKRDNNSPRNFRELYNTFLFHGITPPTQARSCAITSCFYTKVPSAQHDDFIYTCPACKAPLDCTREFFQCCSPFCPTTTYRRSSPHEQMPYHTRNAHLKKTEYSNQLKLSPLAWRTIATPVVLERIIVKYLTKVLPATSSETIQLNENRPGLSIIESGIRVNLDPVATHSAATISNYYSENTIPGETWIIVPDGIGRLFAPLKEKLAGRFKIVTSRSYPYEYLKKFHPNRADSKRVRCR
ncbi:hypothetical protein WKQ99_17860 [Pseudomonas atacamensis]|uniref:hypothetical protein n=1 Tax=Pseudomonas atacamensis TaxID=2565368 RepID=UPI0030D5E4EA